MSTTATATATPTHALVPTVDGDLYGMPGVDLIVTVDTPAEWEPVQRIDAPEGESFEDFDWEQLLYENGWVSFAGDAETVTDEYFIVPIRPQR